MLTQLLFANIHFAITVFSALVFFTSAWLYLEAWKLEKEKKTHLLKSLGFFLLALTSMSHATSLDLPELVFVTQLTKILGLALILFSLIREPLLHPPASSLLIPFALFTSSLMPHSAVLFLFIAITYWHKSTKGHEKQIKPAFVAFMALTLAEFVNVSFFLTNTSIVFWEKLLADYGAFWILSHITETIGIIILGVWVWGYFRYRIQIQLFILFVTSSLVIFVVTTFSFTYLLLKNLEKEALGHLRTDVNVLQFAIERLQHESLANARAVAENKAIQSALLTNDSNELFELSSEFMFAQNTSFLIITSASGKVAMRAEDKERIGDNLAKNAVIKSALDGNLSSTVDSIDGIIAPEISVSAAAPIIDQSATESAQIVGAVLTGFDVDSAFVDGIKKVTGLDVAIFGGNTRTATTFLAPDGKSRFVGTKEDSEKILSKVLERGEDFVGPAQILNQPFFAAYSPLEAVDGQIIGMIFVGKLQNELFETTENSIKLTLLGSVILMMLSTIPAYFISHYIKENLKA